jgi:8-oxo-dGTP diphosphatase
MGKWAFPGGLVGAWESVDQAAARELRERTGVSAGYVEQLYTFGKPERDPATRAVSVSYMALVPFHRVAPNTGAKYRAARWVDVNRLEPLAYDHTQVACLAVQRLRAKLQYTNVVCHLLPKEFTLGEMQRVYETILCRKLDRRNFRKKILALGLLNPLYRQRVGPHRPASLYAFKQRRPMEIGIL